MKLDIIGVTLMNDLSEEIADKLIYKLAKKFLDPIEIHIISIGLKIYSETEIPKIEITKEDWKKYKKEHIENEKEHTKGYNK